VNFLEKIYEKSDKKIPCRAKFRILEDEMVVGVLTESNQFVQINPPIPNMEFGDGLRTMHQSNYILADRDLMTGLQENEKSQNQDALTKLIVGPMSNPRYSMIHKIRLESQFYAAFRNVVSIVLNLYKYREIRKKMVKLFYLTKKTYLSKMRLLEKWLKDMIGGMVIFQEYDETVLSSLQDIYGCQNDGENKKYCFLAESDDGEVYQLILPIQNLVTNELNEWVYYGRIADELLRNKRTRLFMLEPETYSNISMIGASSDEYNIRSESEFILPQFSITPDYYKSLMVFPYGKHARTTGWNTSKPQDTKIPKIEFSWKEEVLGQMK
jgi:hypothetical protein